MPPLSPSFSLRSLRSLCWRLLEFQHRERRERKSWDAQLYKHFFSKHGSEMGMFLIILQIPFFNISMLKLINKPSSRSDSRRYDNNCDLWSGMIFLTDFNSRMIELKSAHSALKHTLMYTFEIRFY